ncbi:hypothetical protein CYMTET_43758 [Cymbomonas tetramitiformis]|uniref:Uncharacterized protein n=1 Tax=Cymbomonas tetramitiformis TaxID=36881 RepID=A0AAE0C1J8_9CHLO|nr:hypothetical protein CYMTET_43758 [Cymbomonas tetramitiformis]
MQGVVDLDSVFAYSTPRWTVIRDRYLGIMSLCFQVLILIYIVFIEILYLKNYLSCEPASGEVLARVQWQDSLTDAQCASFGYSRVRHTKNYSAVELLQTTDSMICGNVDEEFGQNLKRKRRRNLLQVQEGQGGPGDSSEQTGEAPPGAPDGVPDQGESSDNSEQSDAAPSDGNVDGGESTDSSEQSDAAPSDGNVDGGESSDSSEQSDAAPSDGNVDGGESSDSSEQSDAAPSDGNVDGGESSDSGQTDDPFGSEEDQGGPAGPSGSSNSSDNSPGDDAEPNDSELMEEADDGGSDQGEPNAEEQGGGGVGGGGNEGSGEAFGPENAGYAANAVGTSCKVVPSGEIVSAMQVNYFALPMVLIIEESDGYSLEYIRDVEHAYAQLDLTVESSFYRRSQVDKFGGPATRINAELQYANGSVVYRCGDKDNFYGFGSNGWDIRQSCQDSPDEADQVCKSAYGSDLVVPLKALLAAADVFMDETFRHRTARTGSDDMYQQCLRRVTDHGVFGWVKDDAAWEQLKTLQNVVDDDGDALTYPMRASLFFVGLVYDDIADKTYTEILELLQSYCQKATVRQFGVKLLISMTHDNMQGSRGGNVLSSFAGPYLPARIHTTIVASAQLSMLLGPRAYKEENEKRFFSQDMEVLVGHYGEICSFDFSQLLTTMTSALGLLVVARTITDTVMTKVMPLRRLYYKEKYHLTLDYSDLREAALGKNLGLNQIHSISDVVDKKAQCRRTKSGGVEQVDFTASKANQADNLVEVLSEDQPLHVPGAVAEEHVAGTV